MLDKGFIKCEIIVVPTFLKLCGNIRMSTELSSEKSDYINDAGEKKRGWMASLEVYFSSRTAEEIEVQEKLVQMLDRRNPKQPNVDDEKTLKALIDKHKFYQDNSTRNIERLEVYPGQTVKCRNYTIYIQEIKVDKESLKRYKKSNKKHYIGRYVSGSVILWIKKDG
jgi:hypothetical protein